MTGTDMSSGSPGLNSDVLGRLRDPTPLSLAEILAIWGLRGTSTWADTPELYRRLGERVLKLGEPLLAYDILSEGQNRHPKDLQLRHCFVRSLARSGAIVRAIGALEQIRSEGFEDEQTLGLLGSASKKLWAESPALEERQRHLLDAANYYAQAYAAAMTGAPADSRAWVGINAATTAMLLGKTEQAQRLALEVRDFCVQALALAAEGDPNRYWYLATIAEAALVAGKFDVAEEWYMRAAAEARGRLADLEATRRQARTLLEYLGESAGRLDRCFPFPRVVMFAGHMIDQPGRAIPRFPPALEGAVRDAIAAKLRELNAGFGFASAACGADILFLEAMIERGTEVHLVLPYGAEEFRKKSVDIIPGAEWGARFDRVLSRATRVIMASEQRTAGTAVTFDYANVLLGGLATIRARQIGAELSLLAVWDGRPGDGPGGTSTVVQRWTEAGHDVRIVDIASMLKDPAPGIVAAGKRPHSPPTSSATQDNAPALPKQITALLFADAVGFSRLGEEEIPCFVSQFLGKIAVLLATTMHAPVLRATWGDGLYFVFESIESAGRFALDLQDLVESTKWSELGLSDQLELRIALHAGPTYRCVDPVSGQVNYTGSHVSRAARIEPITPPNQVYASQSFVALAAAYDARGFEWDYVGVIPLAKNYGTAPMYHLRRSSGVTAAASSRQSS